MKTQSLSVLLSAAVALAGCETTVDLPEPPHTPRVALLYNLTTAPLDSSFNELFQLRQLYVSNSQRVFDTSELKGRPDATVELRNAAGTVVERYRSVSSVGQYGYSGYAGYYRPVLGFRPQVGQAYTLRATLPGLETAESTLTLPAPAVVESGTYVPKTSQNPSAGQYQGRLTVVLRDDPNAANYYLAFARVLDQQGQPGGWSPVNVDYDSQGNAVGVGQFLLSSPQQQYSIYPFADTDVNGQRISLTTDVRFYSQCYPGSGQPCPQPGYLEVYVSSITKDAYNFYLSRRRYYDSNGNPFAEPAPLASNVKPGYGLFGGATDVTYRVRIP
ncbi:DUF4249 domain-containing protein [Hymenobacter rubidus]|uniref:DUF4249 domain-containing protein n=1 Tax=Hymenobacter rubidus TaxID=1441626 RepID=UPI00191E6542|nr:DUF4249 domain-containing protein [Hymenobacter rubidus]